MDIIYLDNAATSFPKPESVYEAMDYYNRYMGGNPGRGSHRQTLQAGSLVLETRELLARLFNVKDSLQIAFTLNITAAINMALKGLLKPGDHVITTGMEHNALARPLFALSGSGVDWTAVECGPDGSLDPANLKKAIRKNTRLIAMLHASNVTGTIMPIEEIGRIAREHGICFMVDSAQTAGVLEIDTVKQNIDVLTFTGHKALMGPQGTGGLYINPDIEIKALKEGGTGSFSEQLQHPEIMPEYLEAGTLNTPGIIGLNAALKFIMEVGIDKIRSHEQKLCELLISGLQNMPGIKMYGPGDINKQTAVVAINHEQMDCGELGFRLDNEFGIITRPGLHCAPLAHRTIGILERGACRLSPGYFNTGDDIEALLKALHKIAARG
jgi:cysteine desulfurase family protein